MYKASSVAAALRQNKSITIHGLELMACPVKSCAGEPEACVKGQAQTCKKKTDVHYTHDNHEKMVTLYFYYQHKEIPREGFINTKDSSLAKLLDSGVIFLRCITSE